MTHFVKERRLHSITSGIAVESTATSYNAKALGNTILQKMQRHALLELKCKKADQIKTSASISVIRCGDDKLEVNPLLLFDRLVKVSTDLRSDIKYELTPQPSALFDDCGKMRKGTKSSILKDDLLAPNKQSIPAANICHLINGGLLLQKL